MVFHYQLADLYLMKGQNGFLLSARHMNKMEWLKYAG